MNQELALARVIGRLNSSLAATVKFVKIARPRWMKPAPPAPAPAPPLSPPPTTSAAVIARQKEIGRRARSPFVAWLVHGGWVLVALPLLVVGVGVTVLGLPQAVELLIGVASPHDTDFDVLQAVAAWCTSIVGWLAVPALTGGVVGYFVSARLGSYRSRTLDEIKSDRALIDE